MTPAAGRHAITAGLAVSPRTTQDNQPDVGSTRRPYPSPATTSTTPIAKKKAMTARAEMRSRKRARPSGLTSIVTSRTAGHRRDEGTGCGSRGHIPGAGGEAGLVHHHQQGQPCRQDGCWHQPVPAPHRAQPLVLAALPPVIERLEPDAQLLCLPVLQSRQVSKLARATGAVPQHRQEPVPFPPVNPAADQREWTARSQPAPVPRRPGPARQAASRPIAGRRVRGAPAAPVKGPGLGPHQTITAHIRGKCLDREQRLTPKTVAAQATYQAGCGCRFPAAGVEGLGQAIAASHQISTRELDIRQRPQQIRAAPAGIERFPNNRAGLTHLPVLKQFPGTPHHRTHQVNACRLPGPDRATRTR